MSDKKDTPVEVRNPRYAGATPEMVGLALLKHKPKGNDDEVENKPSDLTEQSDVRQNI